MATVRVQGKSVDVSEKGCPRLQCFYLFADKGSFTPGRGYTSYYKKTKWVCGTRHLHGCPRIGICLNCRRVVTPSRKDQPCSCGAVVVLDEDG